MLRLITIYTENLENSSTSVEARKRHMCIDTTAKELKAAGVPAAKIVAVGKSSTMPVVQTTDKKMMEKNRRVGLGFVGIKNTEEFKKVIR